MLQSGVRDRLTADLLRARDEASLVSPPSRSVESFDLDAGYDVGRALHERLVELGSRPVGRKIGFTNPATWAQFGVDRPVWAHVYAEAVHFAVQGEPVRQSLMRMAAPRIEPEIVLGVRGAVPPEGTPEQLVECVEWAALGFEIVDCHYPEWRFTGGDAVADFGAHAALVVGLPWRLDGERPERVADVRRSANVALRRDGAVVAEGQGRNALGSPLLALRRLTAVLAAQPWAPPLRAGEIVTTGTLTPLPYIHPGEVWRAAADGGPLPAVELVTA